MEAIGSLTAELLVRSARDPGASTMADRLFSAKSEDTAFSMTLSPDAGRTRYGDLLARLHRESGATLLGLAQGGEVDLNCPAETSVGPGDTIFYVADRRLDPSALSRAAA